MNWLRRRQLLKSYRFFLKVAEEHRVLGHEVTTMFVNEWSFYIHCVTCHDKLQDEEFIK